MFHKMFKFVMVCPKCNKTSEFVCDKIVPTPDVKCGDCLMDHVEIVAMKVASVKDC